MCVCVYVCTRALADGTSPAERLQTQAFLGQQSSIAQIIPVLAAVQVYVYSHLFLLPMMRIQYPV